jgi:hypothetical protein
MSLPSPSAGFFHADSFKQRFTRDLDDALSRQRIDTGEYRWLAQLTDLPAQAVAADSSIRLNTLTLETGSPIPSELAGASLISHTAIDDERVYLHTLSNGIERFANRKTLFKTLQRYKRSSADVDLPFAQQPIEGDPFEQRMLSLLDQYARQFSALSRSLAKLPLLQEVLHSTLTRHLKALVPDIDPAEHVLHIVRSETSDSGSASSTSIVQVQSLVDALKDDVVGNPLPTDCERSFLGVQGQTLDANQSGPWRQALAAAQSGLKGAYETALADHWQSQRGDGLTHQQGAAIRLAENFSRDIQVLELDGTFSADEFQRLAALLPGAGPARSEASAALVSRLSVSIAGQGPLKLTGMALIDLPDDKRPQLLLYSSSTGFRRFATLDALTAFLSKADQRDEVSEHLSLNDQAVFETSGAMQVRLDVMQHPLFEDLAVSIIALQKRNLSFALDELPANPLQAAAMLDDALDIRSLLDPRILHVNCGERWLERGTSFLKRWTPGDLQDQADSQIPHDDTDTLSWGARLTAVDKQVRALLESRPTLEACARDALNGYLAILGEAPLDAQNIQVHCVQAPPSGLENNQLSTDDTQQTPALASIALTQALVERASGYRRGSSSGQCQVALGDDGTSTVPELTPVLLDHVLDRVSADFSSQYLQRLEAFNVRPYRHDKELWRPDAAALALRENLLWLECGIKQRVTAAESRSLRMLEQVLLRPSRQMRQHLGEAAVEVYSVAIYHDPLASPVRLSNCFVVRKSVGEDNTLLFWSGLNGLHEMTSREVLEARLNFWLTTASSRESWLGLVAEQDAVLLRGYLERSQRLPLEFSLTRIDSSLIRELHEAEQRRQAANLKAGWKFARDCRLPFAACNGLLNLEAVDDRITLALDGVAGGLQSLMLEAMLPDWIANASTPDLFDYSQILLRFYQASGGKDQKDFLADIPLLGEFARQQLVTRLKDDFPGQMLDPNTIWVTMTHYDSAMPPPGSLPSFIPAATHVDSEKLTDFALNHFATIQGATLTVTLPEGSPEIPGFDPRYVEGLIRELDVGTHYRDLIAEKFADPEDYALRRTRFIEQMPSLLLLVAYELRLQKKLSPKAYDFIESIIEMPDGIARQPVHAQNIELRPLQLRAQSGMEPDAVSGVFLIAPEPQGEGPVILLASLSEEFCFKEFTDQAALLADLREPGILQDMVLARLSPLVHSRYANGGFTEAHVHWSVEGNQDIPLTAPGQVSLANDPVKGNALDYLFQQTLSAFKDSATRQTVSTAEANWRSFVHLMTLGTEQILMFLPGRLAFLVGLWQSMSLLKDSAGAIHDLRWGQALSEFSAAMGVLVSTRQTREQEPVEEEPLEPVAPKNADIPAFSWRNPGVTPQLKSRLKAMEVSDVALSHLQKDELYNLYQDPASAKQYAAVEGRVYEVRREGERWRIIGGTDVGPWLKTGSGQQWELDLGGALRGGGALSTRFAVASTDLEVERYFMVEASGMAEIRGSYRFKAQAIERAHAQAITYLKNALYNLRPLDEGRPPKWTRDYLQGFFGLQPSDPLPVSQLTHMIQALLTGMSDWSLAPLSSNRYVVGTNKRDYESTIAFVVKADPLKRIHLTERFFQMPLYRLRFSGGHRGFSAASHFRAVTLIHELSHLVNGTHDIAYLESGAPFTDLLDDTTPDDFRIKTEVTEYQRKNLSHLSQARDLFRKRERTGWRDLEDRDGNARKAILKITGQQNLDNARLIFLTDAAKRSQVMLTNADSVALLITNLGRYRFTETRV